MKIIVDHDLCSGHGRCAALSPSVYRLDATGYNRMGEFEVAVGSEAAAQTGADNCPERAITVID
jgi:ferredoxin